MKLLEKIEVFNKLFDDLQLTNSRNKKIVLVVEFEHYYPELIEDLNYIFETIAGKHPIGWTFKHTSINSQEVLENTIQECIDKCVNTRPKDIVSTYDTEVYFGLTIGNFLEPIVNRTIRLGIGKSLLAKDTAPMLAKKFDGNLSTTDITITEKLDGNRCIAYYDGMNWNFVSRSGKPMNVVFDMSNMPKDYIYDGEVMSREQTDLSIERNHRILNTDIDFNTFCDTKEAQLMFNKTSGTINNKADAASKNLVYNIFDIQLDLHYGARRAILDRIETGTDTVRILPYLHKGILSILSKDTTIDIINNLLDTIVYMGGEGIMINENTAPYQHKRTDKLLKYKKVQTMDLKVIGVEEGTSKYEGMVGALVCYLKTDDSPYIIKCKVGSGLSDEQRERWYYHEDEIIGKIVEVVYHEITSSSSGTYSLRFPRLKKVRADKSSTSEY